MTTTYANGKRPLSTMSVVRGEYFDPIAAAQLILLEADFKAVAGYEAIIREGYRTYARQVELWDKWQAYQNGGPYAELAARPGTSVHGVGFACDFGSGINTFGSANKILMDRLAPARGWHPTGNDFTPREAWHYEFKPGTATAGGVAMPLPHSASNKKVGGDMILCYIDRKVVDVPGKAGVREATWKTVRTFIQYGSNFYRELTRQEEANGIVSQLGGGNAFAVTEAEIAAIKAATGK